MELGPITREEKYLAKMSGQDVNSPAPITRKEKYLSKLAGGENATPVPITREEKILDWLVGDSEIDFTPITRIEIFMFAAGDESVSAPKPVTREEIFWDNISISSETIVEIEGELPLTINSNGDDLLDYRIYGNTVQNGEPSPDNPVEVVGVGNDVKIVLDEPLNGIGDYKDTLDLSTGILTRRIKKLVLTGEEGFDNIWGIFRLNIPGVLPQSRTTSVICTHYKGLTNITATDVQANPVDLAIRFRVNYEQLLISDSTYSTAKDFKSFLSAQYEAGTPVTVWYVLAEPETISVPPSLTGIIEGYTIQDGEPSPDNPIYPTSNGELQEDGTYYIPYGYEVDITTSNGTDTITTPVYIGDEPLHKIGEYADYVDYERGVLVRRIKKLVLTGEETIYLPSNFGYGYSTYRININGIKVTSNLFCNHFVGRMSNNYYVNQNCVTQLMGTTQGIFSVDNSIANAHDQTDNTAFKQFLADQYNAGTPVTVWYVLAEPEEIPLENLNPIPTFDGTTIIDYDGEPKPSKMYAEYTTKQTAYVSESGEAYRDVNGQLYAVKE